MNKGRIFITLEFCCFIILFGFVVSIELKSEKNVSASISHSVLNSDLSHEESHSQNAPSTTVKHMVTKNVNTVASNATNETVVEPEKKSFINTNKTHSVNNTKKNNKNNATQVASVHIIATEGGTIDLHDSSKHKAESVTDKHEVSNTSHSQEAFSKTSINSPKLNISKTTIVIKEEEITTSEKPKSKRIHGRPGVDFGSETPLPVPSSTSSPSTAKPKKPLFTMITGDKESKESESFIESPTTGRDYVLPIVLIILALPIVGYIIKLIYKRGTEFTERQQYHRMYLIDGMYNSR